jgi:hypothetical protein
MTLKVFGYIIQLRCYKKKHAQNPEHPGVTVGASSFIGYDDGYFFLLDPDGRKLPGQLSMVVKDEVNQPMRAKVELFVKPKPEWKPNT